MGDECGWKRKEIIEKYRITRLEKAKNKGITSPQKIFEKEQNKRIEELPENFKKKVEQEQAKEERLELKRAKESVCILRTTEKKIEQTEQITNI